MSQLENDFDVMHIIDSELEIEHAITKASVDLQDSNSDFPYSIEDPKAIVKVNDVHNIESTVEKRHHINKEKFIEGIWKGRNFGGKRVDPHSQKIHIVVSYCLHDMKWITNLIHGYNISSINIISKCGRPVQNAPPNSKVILLPNVGRNDHSFIYYIRSILDSEIIKTKSDPDNTIVVFLKDNQHAGHWKSNFNDMMSLAASEQGFGCAKLPYIPYKKPDEKQYSAYHETSVLLNFTLGGYKHGERDVEGTVEAQFQSRFLNLGHFLSTLQMKPVDEFVMVCYGGIFAASLQKIRKIHQSAWKRLGDELIRGDNIEEGHFMERTWAILLSTPLTKSEVKNIKKYLYRHYPVDTNHCCFNGALIHSPLQDDESLWKGRYLEGGKNDKVAQNIHIVISHCSHDMKWITDLINGYDITSINVISKCNNTALNAPPDSIILDQNFILNYGQSYAYYITTLLDSIMVETKSDIDSSIVVFLKDDGKHLQSSTFDDMLRLASSKQGFGCGLIPHKDEKFQYSAYHDSSVLREFQMTDDIRIRSTSSSNRYQNENQNRKHNYPFRSRAENLGGMWRLYGFNPKKKVVQVCYGGIFAASVSSIKKFDWIVWKKLEAMLSRGEDIEENYFMERTWGLMLSTPVSSFSSNLLIRDANSVERLGEFKGSLQKNITTFLFDDEIDSNAVILNASFPQTLNFDAITSTKSGSRSSKNLVYLTTHLSSYHAKFLKFCWPAALQNSQLLNSSDIMVFATIDTKNISNAIEGIDLLKTTFINQNLTIQLFENEGKQKGAIHAMRAAPRNHYFDRYEWVIRLNPDVIIQDDSWMLDTMRNDPGASLLYVRCKNDFNTDFFILKVSNINKNIFLQDPGKSISSSTRKGEFAEHLFTEQMKNNMNEDEFRQIPDVVTRKGVCRVIGDPKLPADYVFPVVHYHREYEYFVDTDKCPSRFMNYSDYIPTQDIDSFWKGRYLEGEKNDKVAQNIHIIISHCSHDMKWITDLINGYDITSINVISKCNNTALNAPPDSIILDQNFILNYGQSYAYYITTLLDSIMVETKSDIDSSIVVFLKDDGKHLQSSTFDDMLRLASSKQGFGCGLIPHEDEKFQYSAYHDSSVLREFQMTDDIRIRSTSSSNRYQNENQNRKHNYPFRSRAENLGGMWRLYSFNPKEKVVQVCYGGIFAASVSSIKKFDWIVWKKLEAMLSRGEDIEENYFMERTWGLMLSTPVSSLRSNLLIRNANSVERLGEFKGSLQKNITTFLFHEEI